MAIPIYVVCKSKANTITNIGSELPKKEGNQILQGNIHCKHEKLGEVFHYHFKIDGSKLFIGNESFEFQDRAIEIQINVRSHEGRKSTKLEYLIIENFQVQNEEKFSLKALEKLDYGIKVLNNDEEKNLKSKIVLDYIRSNLFNINEFKEVPTTSDLNEKIHKYIFKAKKENVDLYILGDLYPSECRGDEDREEKLELLRQYGPKGIHDIHMNQGNSKEKRFVENNGIYQDGGVFIHFKTNEEDNWTAIFLKFEEQNVDGIEGDRHNG